MSVSGYSIVHSALLSTGNELKIAIVLLPIHNSEVALTLLPIDRMQTTLNSGKVSYSCTHLTIPPSSLSQRRGTRARQRDSTNGEPPPYQAINQSINQPAN